MIKKEYVTWEMVDQFIDKLVEEYRGVVLRGVYGLPRGGLVFAVMISHRLHIPMLSAPCRDCLIVDDICDTGESLLHYVKNSSALDMPYWTIATMYHKKNKLGIEPDFYMFDKEDKWVVFPWEDTKEV